MAIDIPQTKVGRASWYASHFPRIKHSNLLKIATTPERIVMDDNERTVAIMAIVKDGIKSKEELWPLLSLVKDENDYPIISGTKDSKENNALLRGYAAIAIAKYINKFINYSDTLAKTSPGYFLERREALKIKDEFSNTLKQILNSVASDPIFIPQDKNISTLYFTQFLEALYLIDKESANPIIDVFSSEEEIKRHIEHLI